MSDTQPAPTAIGKIDEAVEKIIGARNLCDRLRTNAQRGETITIRHIEQIEDQLFDALGALGQ